ncbi:Pseudouridine-5'-phosphate glycosidase protein [Raphanus sativus]|nr:Pseudouridine-5'-phosphate glycosidase protein [Raphanus sativus]
MSASEEGSTAIENTGAFALYRCWEELEFSDLKGSFILSSDSLNWCKIWGSHLVQWYSVLTIVSMATRSERRRTRTSCISWEKCPKDRRQGHTTCCGNKSKWFGIQVFVTGGIGGVHRHANDLWTYHLILLHSEELYRGEQNVTGNAGPYLLARVNELTGDTSLTANIALVKINALIGSQIAVALYQLT